MTDGTRLHALGGEPPPPELAGDLRSWAMLPRRARDGFWELLQPNLAPEVDERITARVQALMKELELTPAQLAPPVRACRTLMREAARHDVSPEQFASDIDALVGDDAELSAAAKRWYQNARPLLRQEIVMTTLAENGRIATAVSWRVDMVTRSSRGKGINKPVAVFTFRYAEGKREQQITLQMLPELVDELRNACSEILGE